MSKTITLSDLEIATAIAALHVLAAEPATTFGQREALERLAERLQKAEPLLCDCGHEMVVKVMCPICDNDK